MPTLNKDRLLELFDAVQTVANMGIWELDLDTDEVICSEEVYRIHEVPVGKKIKVKEALNFYHADYRQAIKHAVTRAITKGETYDLELKIVTRKKNEIWVRAIGIPVVENGKTIRLGGLFQNINDRKVVEEKEKKTRIIADMAVRAGSIGIWHWDIANESLQWNDAMHRIFDWSESKFTGKYEDFSERIHPDDIGPVECALQEAVKGGEKYDVEYRVIAQDKSIRYIKASGDMDWDVDGKPKHMIGVCMDVTQSRESLVKQKALQDQLMFFFKHTPAAVAMLDNNLHYLMVSDRWYQDYHLKDQHIIGKHLYDVFPQMKNSQEWQDHHKKVLQGKSFKRDEELFVRENGERQWLRYELYPWYGREGQIEGMGIFTEDITIKKEYEIYLKDSEERFRASIENALTGMVLASLDGKFFKVNRAFCEMLEYAEVEILGKTFSEITIQEDLAMSKLMMAELRQGKREGFQIQKKYLSKSGKVIWGFLSVSIAKDGNGKAKFLIAQVQNISGQKEAEMKIKQLNESLEQKVKERTAQLQSVNQELEAFCYSVSHDLRSPLRSIHGFSEALSEDYSTQLDEQGKDYINRILKGSLRMAQLIDDLLDLSRISRKEVNKSEVNLSDLAISVSKETAERYSNGKKNNGYDFKISNGLTAYCDSRLMMILLENLFDNACKFSVNSERPYIEFGAKEQNEERIFFIKDNGVGFDMAFSENLFGAFQRLHSQREFPGTGIGLATVKRVITRHNGHIWAQSKLGEGTTFYFTLNEKINHEEPNNSIDRG